MLVTFKSDITKRKKIFTPESFSHPAKAHLGMMLWVVGKYTKPGDTILDPMAGAGSTMIAIRYGRNVVLVELEEKFVAMAEANWGKIKSLPKLKWGLGDCQIIQGDARDLAGLLVDVAVFSPPYEGSLETGSRHTAGGIPSRDKKLGQTGTYADLDDEAKSKISQGFQSEKALKILRRSPRGYSGEADNIGNLKNTTYLEAMRQVYQQCYQVLKPNGLMILITKDFIRNKQRVLLSVDTLKLCEQVGFVLEDWHERKILNQSFWRVLYSKKHPEVEKLETEDILVFRKHSGEGIVDVVSTSPPFGDTSHSQGNSAMQKDIIDKKHTWAGQEYSANPENIGNLPYRGIVDAVVASPPYAETFSVHAGGHMRLTELNKRTVDLSAKERQEAKELAIYSRNRSNISNLPYGSVDRVITSQPYPAISPAYTREGEDLRLQIAKERGVTPDKVSFLDYTKGRK